MLTGKKTYICAFLGAVVVVAHFFGYFDSATVQQFLELLGFAGLAALRSAVGGK